MKVTCLTMSLMVLLLAACKVERTAGEQAAQPAPQDQPAPAPATTPPAAQVPGATFDLDAVAVSTVPLGSFPFVALPNGYAAEDEQTMDFARFPFGSVRIQ